MPVKLTIPFNFEPRGYQYPFLDAMDNGCKRAVCVWHRRAGKDKTFLNHCIKRMYERVGTYYYYFPTATMGRKILWDGIDKNGMRFLDHFPEPLRDKVNDQEMKIRLKNGSVFQVIGTDRLDVVGTNPVGCTFSEFSLQNPKGWDYVRPILAENDGWAVFNYTPRGHNHGKVLYDMATANPQWFVSRLTVDDTGAVSQEAIDAERAAGMSDEMIQQEFYCSFNLGIEGAYYAKYVDRALLEGRIGNVSHTEGTHVYTFWDLGIGDSTAIWFAQFVGTEIHVIEHYENSGEPISHYVKLVQRKPYIYAEHYAPHDVQNRTLQTGRTTLEMARELGIRFRVLGRDKLEDGIEATRGILDKCWFDQPKCKRGLEALQMYRRAKNERLSTEDKPVFGDKPLHDWSSHSADAFRYLAMAYRYHIVRKGLRIGFPEAVPDAVGADRYTARERDLYPDIIADIERQKDDYSPLMHRY